MGYFYHINWCRISFINRISATLPQKLNPLTSFDHSSRLAVLNPRSSTRRRLPFWLQIEGSQHRMFGLDPREKKSHIGVSKHSGTPKSSILIGFSIINHPFWGTPIFGNIHMHHSTFRWLKITSWSYFFQQFAGKNWMLGRKSTQIASL